MIYRVNLNGRTYEVEVEMGNAAVVKEYVTYSEPPATAVQEEDTLQAVQPEEVVTSPVPGTILSVDVHQGQAVRTGDLLLVLEAMKMENEIVAPIDGTVIQVHISKGVSVDSGTPLISIG